MMAGVFLVVAALYATVGNGGASGYLAVMALAGFVKHHEIVAGALHFGETDSHAVIIRRPRGRV